MSQMSVTELRVWDASTLDISAAFGPGVAAAADFGLESCLVADEEEELDELHLEDFSQRLLPRAAASPRKRESHLAERLLENFPCAG